MSELCKLVYRHTQADRRVTSCHRLQPFYLGCFGGFCAGTGNDNNDDDDNDDVLSLFIVIGQRETSKDQEKEFFIPEDHIKTIKQNPKKAAEKLIGIFYKYLQTQCSLHAQHHDHEAT